MVKITKLQFILGWGKALWRSPVSFCYSSQGSLLVDSWWPLRLSPVMPFDICRAQTTGYQSGNPSELQGIDFLLAIIVPAVLLWSLKSIRDAWWLLSEDELTVHETCSRDPQHLTLLMFRCWMDCYRGKELWQRWLTIKPTCYWVSMVVSWSIHAFRVSLLRIQASLSYKFIQLRAAVPKKDVTCPFK